jgi:ABC-type sugar transport system substrate-binding protein
MKKLRFLISLPTSENDFQLAQALSAEQTAQKRAIDLEIVYADNDAIAQSTQILKAIQVPVGTRPDAIVIEPASGTALPQVARRRNRMGRVKPGSRLHFRAAQNVDRTNLFDQL